MKEAKMFGIIYLITNAINDKKYVGQTIKSLKRRSNAHKRDAFKYQSSLPLHRAMRKYGIENFNNAKLKEQDVLEIRKAVQNGTSRKSLAKQYNINYNQICKIINKQRWKHV